MGRSSRWPGFAPIACNRLFGLVYYRIYENHRCICCYIELGPVVPAPSCHAYLIVLLFIKIPPIYSSDEILKFGFHSEYPRVRNINYVSISRFHIVRSLCIVAELPQSCFRECCRRQVWRLSRSSTYVLQVKDFILVDTRHERIDEHQLIRPDCVCDRYNTCAVPMRGRGLPARIPCPVKYREHMYCESYLNYGDHILSANVTVQGTRHLVADTLQSLMFCLLIFCY
jgi:hypothetical protein